jgi:hypothetical protein
VVGAAARDPQGAPLSGPAIFTRDGDLFVPGEHAVGPWDEGSLHGGAPAALLARAIEALPTPAPMRLARLGVAFLRPVPRAPIEVGAEIVRPGRRLQFARAWVRSAGEDVLQAMGTLIRVGDVAVPRATHDAASLPGPHESRPEAWGGEPATAAFHLTGMEVRFARGDWEPGAAVGWFRFAMPLVAGEDPSPAQRAVAAADFGNGVSRSLDFETHLFVNTDLTVHLHRPPVGEWVALDARTDLDGAGLGQATSVLYDERGRVGVAAQSLFVDER